MFASVSVHLAPLGAIVVLVIWGVARIKKLSRHQLLDSRSDIGSLRKLSWREFEQLVGEAYRRQGYAVEEVGGGGADGGVDLILRRGGETTLVQCKQWKSWKVGVKIIRELYGVMAAKGASRGIVVACGRFTQDAKRFADGKPLQLVDERELWNLVKAVKGNAGATPNQRPAPESSPRNSAPPACPKCGAAMVLRTARRGSNAGEQFYGCSTYPACRGIRKLGEATVDIAHARGRERR